MASKMKLRSSLEGTDYTPSIAFWFLTQSCANCSTQTWPSSRNGRKTTHESRERVEILVHLTAAKNSSFAAFASPKKKIALLRWTRARSSSLVLSFLCSVKNENKFSIFGKGFTTVVWWKRGEKMAPWISQKGCKSLELLDDRVWSRCTL